MRAKRNINNHAQFYKLLQNTTLPRLQNPSNRYNPETSPQKATQRIVKSQQYLYIDYDQQTGCRPMEKINPNTLDEQVQKIGNSYVWNLKSLSQRNQQTIQYLNKLKQSQQLKQDVRKLLKNELDSSISRLNKRKKYKLDYQKYKQHQKLQFDPMKLRQMVQTDHFENLNSSIYEKQRKLIEKFGISKNYVSVSPENTFLENNRYQNGKSVKKKRLPSISHRTIDR